MSSLTTLAESWDPQPSALQVLWYLQSVVDKDHSDHISNDSLTCKVHQITIGLTILDVEWLRKRWIDHPWLIVQNSSDTAVAETVPTYF